jgi:methyl-accepting chemotaxis protein
VRGLAQRSAEAAKEIKSLISSSTSQVGEGVNLVRDTGKALERILVQVADVNRVVSEIAAGAKEQTTGLMEVNTAVNRMDQVTQQNAAMVEETAAASLNLRHEADNLMKLVSRFQVGGETAAPRAAEHSAANRVVAMKPALAKASTASAKPSFGKPLPPKAPAFRSPAPKSAASASRPVASASRTATAAARKPPAELADQDWEEF